MDYAQMVIPLPELNRNEDAAVAALIADRLDWWFNHD